MSISKKIMKYIMEKKVSSSDKKEIDNFVKLLVKKKVKVFGEKNFDKLLDASGLDTSFIFDYWPEIKKELEKVSIKVESEISDDINVLNEFTEDI